MRDRCNAFVSTLLSEILSIESTERLSARDIDKRLDGFLESSNLMLRSYLLIREIKCDVTVCSVRQ